MRIVLLFGGSSSERFVSYNSAKAIYTALKQNHEVTCIDPAMSHDSFSFEKIDFITYQTLAYKKANEIDSVESLFNCIKHIKYNLKTDFVFLGLHGGYGEDGFLQDCLNRFSLKYSGSSELPSKLAMNKHMSKQIMLSANVVTAKWLIRKTIFANPLDLLQTLSLPVVVKPNSGGSSVALTIVNELTQLNEAITLALKEDEFALIEEFIAGRELTVTILDNKAYPVIEIKPKSGIYDYESKYTKGMTEYLVPAPINAELTNSVQENALRCFKALGLEVYGRIDYRLNDKDQFFCLEANTLPGMTDTSLVPKSVKAEGMTFDLLINEILQASLKRY